MKFPGKNNLIPQGALLWLVCATLMWSCGKDDESPKFDASFPNGPTLSAQTTSKSLSITAPGPWEISLSFPQGTQSWCSASPLSGEGNATVWFTIPARNTDPAPRTVTVTLSGEGKTRQATLKQYGTIGSWDNIELPALGDLNWVIWHSPGDYTFEYAPAKKHSKWVAWKLDKNYMGSSGRSEAWGWDPMIPSQYAPVQADFAGYQRGHICPSADRTVSYAMNEPTFYYSNMTPQVGAFNGGIWGTLENRLRAIAKGKDVKALYICAGGTIMNEDQIKGYSTPNGMAVPKYNFKVVVREFTSGKWDGIGFWFTNEGYGREELTTQDTKTIRQIEQLTGFDFFHNLETTLQNTVETQANFSAW